MNVTLFSQDFEQGSISSSGNADSTTRIRTIGFISLDNSTNLTDITFTVTSEAVIKINILGYDDNFNLIFNRSWYNSPYTLSISSYANLSHIRLVLQLSSGNITVNDLEKVEIVSECTWLIGNDEFPTNIEFIDIPESSMEKPYPMAVWRIEPGVNDGFPFNELLPLEKPSGAFMNAQNLEYAYIPRSCKKIGEWAFTNTKLCRVKISEDCEYYPTSFPPDCEIEFYGGGGEYGQLLDSEGYAIIDAGGARIYVKE